MSGALYPLPKILPPEAQTQTSSLFHFPLQHLNSSGDTYSTSFGFTHKNFLRKEKKKRRVLPCELADCFSVSTTSHSRSAVIQSALGNSWDGIFSDTGIWIRIYQHFLPPLAATQVCDHRFFNKGTQWVGLHFQGVINFHSNLSTFPHFPSPIYFISFSLNKEKEAQD